MPANTNATKATTGPIQTLRRAKRAPAKRGSAGRTPIRACGTTSDVSPILNPVARPTPRPLWCVQFQPNGAPMHSQVRPRQRDGPPVETRRQRPLSETACAPKCPPISIARSRHGSKVRRKGAPKCQIFQRVCGWLGTDSARSMSASHTTPAGAKIISNSLRLAGEKSWQKRLIDGTIRRS